MSTGPADQPRRYHGPDPWTPLKELKLIDIVIKDLEVQMPRVWCLHVFKLLTHIDGAIDPEFNKRRYNVFGGVHIIHFCDSLSKILRSPRARGCCRQRGQEKEIPVSLRCPCALSTRPVLFSRISIRANMQ